MIQNQKSESRILPVIGTISLVVIVGSVGLELSRGNQAGAIALVIALIYFLPWFNAIERDSPQRTAIGLLNLLLGWTFLGWVIALVWSAKRYDFK